MKTVGKSVVLPEPLTFEWDKGNELKSWIKHGIKAQEAEDAFYDKNRLVLQDIKHSHQEERFILFDKTKAGQLLFIVFTVRNNKIRITSARNIKRNEELMYEKAISAA